MRYTALVLAIWVFMVPARAQIGLAAGAPDGAALPAVRALTPAEERRLVIDICEAAWRESEHTDYSGRDRLLVPLAMVDPDRAQALIAALPPTHQERVRAVMREGLRRADPKPPDPIDPATADAYALLQAARDQVVRDPTRAREYLDKGIAGARAYTQAWRAGQALGAAAGVARLLGDPRAPALAAEAIGKVPQAVHDADAAPEQPAYERWGTVRSIAEAVAGANPEAALAIVKQVPSPAAREVMPLSIIAHGVLPVDPRRALALLDAFPPGHPEGNAALQWSYAAGRVALVLAREDPEGALALVRRMPSVDYRAEVLVALARGAPPERAGALCREALEALAQGLPHAETPARLAEWLPDTPLRRRACALALELAGRQEYYQGRGTLVAQAAYSLAAADPEAARLLLEDALASCPQGQEADRQRRLIARAFVRVDPVRAVAVAREIPLAKADQRFGALCSIARYLVADPAVRVRLPFSSYDPLGTQMPGEEVDW